MIALDTHALVWWVADPERIPARSRRMIAAAIKGRERLAVSSISMWEIAMLIRRDRLQLSIAAETWMGAVQTLPFLNFVAVDDDIAIRAVHLADFSHRDPADRMIVATALGLGAVLVTADRRLRAYKALRTAWD